MRKDNSLLVNISAREGQYANMPDSRSYLLQLPCSAIPQRVIYDGKELDYNFIGEELTLEIPMGELACNRSHKREIV